MFGDFKEEYHRRGQWSMAESIYKKERYHRQTIKGRSELQGPRQFRLRDRRLLCSELVCLVQTGGVGTRSHMVPGETES